MFIMFLLKRVICFSIFVYITFLDTRCFHLCVQRIMTRRIRRRNKILSKICIVLLSSFHRYVYLLSVLNLFDNSNILHSMNIQSLLPISRFDVSSANMLDRVQQSSASIFVSSIFHTDRVTAALHSSSFHEYQTKFYGSIFPDLSIQGEEVWI